MGSYTEGQRVRLTAPLGDLGQWPAGSTGRVLLTIFRPPSDIVGDHPGWDYNVQLEHPQFNGATLRVPMEKLELVMPQSDTCGMPATTARFTYACALVDEDRMDTGDEFPFRTYKATTRHEAVTMHLNRTSEIVDVNNTVVLCFGPMEGSWDQERSSSVPKAMFSLHKIERVVTYKVVGVIS